MSTLSGFWHGAAALSGRLDLSMARLSGQPLTSLSQAALRASGICDRHLKRLRTAPALKLAVPFITIGDEYYPAHLAAVPFAPPVLFYRGNPQRLNHPGVAIIGARRCTHRGRDMADRLARGLVQSGLTIISGMAYGIDAAAHKAHPGQAIAVLGQGLEASMSSRTAQELDRIVDAGGLVVTEFLPRFPASKYTFPQRNRIISGLALGTIVVEASLRSGSRITARHTLEQGRELMVVPGHPLDTASTGCNALIMEGAGLVRNTEDVLNQLGIDKQNLKVPRPSCSIQRGVLKALESGDNLDHIAALTGTDIPGLMVSIQSLELTGHLVRLPGDRLALRSTT